MELKTCAEIPGDGSSHSQRNNNLNLQAMLLWGVSKILYAIGL